MAATSLFLASFTPKTLSLPKPQTPPLPFSLSSSTSLVAFPSSSKRFVAAISPFVRNVAVSSEYEQQELLSEDEEVPYFSPDLKIFVGNLPFTVESADLADLFANAGNVQMVEVIHDKITGRSRGFGFVTMSTAREAEAAAQQFNGYEFEGRQLRVNAGPPPPRDSTARNSSRGGRSFESSHRVHVSNLSWEVEDSDLKAMFGEQGDVLEAKVIYDRESGRSRGFGFVTYSSAEEVNNAIQSLDGVDLSGRPIRVNMAETRQRRGF